MKRFLVALAAMFALPAFSQVQPTVDLSISPATGAGSTNVVLTWTSVNAVACTASGGWSGDKPVNGTETLTGVVSSRTYKLSCRSALGPMNIQWTAVTERIDGTAGVAVSYRIHEATTSTGVPSATPISVLGNVLSTTLWLPSGVHYVGVKAVDSDGFTSVMSNLVSKNVLALSASDSVTFTSISRLRAPSLQLATN